MKKNIIYTVLVIIAIVVVIVLLKINKKCVVSYDTEGGTIYAAQNIKCGNKVAKPADPVLEGYRFVGWFLNDKEYDFNQPVEKDVMIKAKFEEIK